MTRSLKEFSKRQRNKYERQQLKKQKELKRGRFTRQTANAMSGSVGRPMYYMVEKDDIKDAKLKKRTTL